MTRRKSNSMPKTFRHGICWLEPHHLGYISNMGTIPWTYYLTCWIPEFIQHMIVTVFNHITCKLLGHMVMGPWDIEGTHIKKFHIKKFCAACCKEWED